MRGLKMNKLNLTFLLVLLILVGFVMGAMVEYEVMNESLKSKYSEKYRKMYSKFENQTTECRCNYNVTIPPCTTIQKIVQVDPLRKNKFQLIVQSLANERDYELDVWDCTEFANSLVERLKDYGYKSAKTVFVNVDCKRTDLFPDTYACEKYDGGHLIVNIGGRNGIYIEATTGIIIVPEYYTAYGIKG